jgi:hypothetical protein
MRFLGLAALIGLSFSVLGASAASADQCPQKESPIRTDRPDVTNSSVVVPQGSFQSENGINFSQRDGDHEFDGTNSRLRWGIAPCLEVLVDLPTYFAAVSGPLNSGFTNVIPAIKWQISPVPGKIDLSATLGGRTADRQQGHRGSGSAALRAISVVVGIGWRLGHQRNVNEFHCTRGPDQQASTETTFVLEREFAERAFLFVEYVGYYHVHGGPSYLFNSGSEIYRGYDISVALRTESRAIQARGMIRNTPIMNALTVSALPRRRARPICLNGRRQGDQRCLFMIELSASDTDVQRNIQLLKENQWFDIPIVYINGSRAILAVEKKVRQEFAPFAEAFAAWEKK